MGKGIFDGIRYAECALVAFGPTISKLFAEHGATVIKIESGTAAGIDRMTRPYTKGMSLNRSAFFNLFNNDKYGITLNLKHPKGLDIAKRLIATCDIFAQGFTPGTIERLGLGYDELKKIKPDLIMLNLSIQGQTGPNARHPGYGDETQSLTGFTHLTGFPDGDPQMPWRAYTDFFTQYYGVATLVGALEHRRLTGEGMYIDLSQHESALEFLEPLLLNFFANGEVANRTGNRSIYSGGAPEGAYQCLGDDRWCVISVTTDKEWETFCRVLGNPGWTREPRFSTFLGRREHADELDTFITEWTSGRSAEEVMDLLQSAGVDAGVVQNARDLSMDPQFRYRQHFSRLPDPDPEVGSYLGQSPAFRFSKTPAVLKRSAPSLGEHTELVCTQMLGMSDEEFINLLNEGVFE